MAKYTGWWRWLMPTLRYCSQTEVHVFALSIAASVLLSFFPFLVIMISLCQYVFHWQGAVDAIYFALSDAFPGDLGKFLLRNLMAKSGPMQYTSMFLLLFTANGVFEPLEVALNSVWEIPENRSYLKNQVLSLGMIVLCGGLILGSFLMTAQAQALLRERLALTGAMPGWIAWTAFKIAAVPVTVLALFLTYWLLPNRRLPLRPCARAAIVVGLGLEALKYIYLLVWRLLETKLVREYGPFHNSVTIILLSFAAAVLVLAGAEWTARDYKESVSKASGIQ